MNINVNRTKPLRVLHVIGAMDRGGAETLIMNLYRSIDRNKVQFDFLVNSDRECDYDREIQSLGGRLYHIERYNLLNHFSYIKDCDRFFKGRSYEIVHGHIGLPAAFYLSSAKKYGSYTIAHSHAQNYPLSAEEIAFRTIAFRVRGKADYYLACSKAAGIDRFGRSIADSNNFHVLKNGIDVKRYRYSKHAREITRQKLGVNNHELLFGHVGRLTKVKNHEYLFKVFKEILVLRPQSRLLVIGRGELEEELKHKAKKDGIDKNVWFLGVREDIPELLSAMDALIFPSFKEGLSCTLIEAQTNGLPCIVSQGVPQEAKFNDNVNFMSLELAPSEWAKAAINSIESSTTEQRGFAYESAISNGFCIEESSKWLEAFYLNKRMNL